MKDIELLAAMVAFFNWYLRTRNPGLSPGQKGAITYYENVFRRKCMRFGIDNRDLDRLLNDLEKSMDNILIELKKAGFV